MDLLKQRDSSPADGKANVTLLNGTPPPAATFANNEDKEEELLKGIVPSADSNLFRGLLFNWLYLTTKYADTWDYKDAPWLHGEKAEMGLLASAAWETSGMALEEYVTAKKNKAARGKAAKDKNSSAICDLSLQLNGTNYLCGVERITIPLKETVAKGIKRSQEALTLACNTIQNLELGEGAKTLGIVFATLESPRPKSGWEKCLAGIRDAVRQWHGHLKANAAKQFTAAAWFFPLNFLETLQNARGFYPGCAVFIRQFPHAG